MFCGECQQYIVRPNGEDFCAKTGKVVPYLAERECFEARGIINNDESIKPMKETNKPQTKVCTVCGRELPIDSFPTHPKSKDGHTSTCKECHSKKLSEGQKHSQGATLKKPEPQFCKEDGLVAYDAAVLVAELRARGYDVKCTKTIEL